MLHHGKIQTCDTAKGSGTIAPETGGQMVEFGRADLHRNAAEPKVGSRSICANYPMDRTNIILKLFD